MKRNLYSAINALLALGGACLLFSVFANAAPPGESIDSGSPLDNSGLEMAWDDDSDDDSDSDRHWRRGVRFVAGNAYTSWADDSVGYIERSFAVVKTRRDVARGHMVVDYFDDYGDEVYATTFVVKADCLNIKRRTREAWVSGEVVQVTGDFPSLGTVVVFYVDDNDGANPFNPDIHGDIFSGAEWGEPDYTCNDRPDPWFPDPSQRGKIIVR